MSAGESPLSVGPARTAPAIVVMGVSAAGKSTIAAALAATLGLPWRDADDLHPRANVEKMARGIPLVDDDRVPWLDIVGRELRAGVDGAGIVMACSSLRRAYRDRMRSHAPNAVFVHLTGPPELLASRAARRVGHFMPPALLASQIEVLEDLEPDEDGAAFTIAPPVPSIVASVDEWLRRRSVHIGPSAAGTRGAVS